jgi:predicted DNA-binding transcriptional regulator YafY
VAVGDWEKNALGQQGSEKLDLFLVAGWTEPAAFAGEGQQVVFLAMVAADAGEPALQIAAVHELDDHLGDDGPQKAVTGLSIDDCRLPIEDFFLDATFTIVIQQSTIGNYLVARDLDYLRDEENAPLAYDEARHGYVLTDETYALPPVNISRKEAFSFGLARNLLAHYEGTPLHLDMKAVLDKIAESLEGEVTLEPDWLSEHVDVLPEDRVRIDPELWGRMVGFIERRESIRARYQTFDGRESEYRLHPYHLLAYHGNWYLLAQNVEKNRMATFALSRFREVEGTGESFQRTPDFDTKAYAREAFGITRGEKTLRVRLLFEPKLAVYIMERDWHTSQTFKKRPDGRVEMRLETSGRQELIRWVLSWMPDVRVLAPNSLKDRIEEKLRDGLARQSGVEEVSTSSSSGQAAEP